MQLFLKGNLLEPHTLLYIVNEQCPLLEALAGFKNSDINEQTFSKEARLRAIMHHDIKKEHNTQERPR